MHTTPLFFFFDMLTLSRHVFDQQDHISEGNVIKSDIRNAAEPRQWRGFATQCEVVSS